MTVLSLCATNEPLEPDDLGVARVRRELFAGLASKSVFAKAAGRTVRTVDIWVNLGMPVVYLGQTPLVKIDAARDWLLSRRAAHPNMPRRGRLYDVPDSLNSPSAA